MIGLDTNVVVRVLVEDDQSQLARVNELLALASEEGERAFVSDLVIMELEWVLESAYGVPRSKIAHAIQALLADDRFTFEHREDLTRAIARYEKGDAALSDYLIGDRAQRSGTRTTYTFDRALRDDERFTLL